MMLPLAIILESTVEGDCPQVEIDELRENSLEIAAALEKVGYRTEVVPFPLDTASVRTALEARQPDVVFNLVDSIEGKGNLVAMAPMLLAHMGIPFTGATAQSTTISCDKLITKQLLSASGLPTPEWRTEAGIMAAATELKRPYILKSITEHASFGMFADSVVKDAATLRTRLQEKKAKYGSEWFAEEYIEGREFNLSVLDTPEGPAVLPCAEIVFTEEFPKDKPRIVDYAAKWYEDSAECKGTVRSFDFKSKDEALLAQLQQMALKCWYVFGLTGYARVDFRVDESGKPYVLEVNCNPFLTAAEGMGAAAAKAGWQFEDLIFTIVSEAYHRVGKPLALAA